MAQIRGAIFQQLERVSGPVCGCFLVGECHALEVVVFPQFLFPELRLFPQPLFIVPGLASLLFVQLSDFLCSRGPHGLE